MLLKKYKIVYEGDYVILMKRSPYDLLNGQCYMCRFDDNLMCTQIYLSEQLRLCDVCGRYSYPYMCSGFKPWKNIYKIENYAKKKM